MNNIPDIDDKANKGADTNNNIMAKKSMSVSVSEELLDKFNKRCKDDCTNRSALFEKWIEEYLNRKVKPK